MSGRKGDANQLVYLPRLLAGSSRGVATLVMLGAAEVAEEAAALSSSVASRGRLGRPTGRFCAAAAAAVAAGWRGCSAIVWAS
jgi:hypothetical protein